MEMGLFFFVFDVFKDFQGGKEEERNYKFPGNVCFRAIGETKGEGRANDDRH